MPIWWERVRHLASRRAHSHSALPDLRDLESASVQVKGTQFLVHDPERRHGRDRVYVIRREPRNRRDASAIAVYASGRSIGYVPRVRAARMAPLLDQLGGAAVVNGTGADPDSIRLSVDLPTIDALSAYVRSYDAA